MKVVVGKSVVTTEGKGRGMKGKPKSSVGVLAKAERILNQTLAYQAAIAIHDLKDRLDLDIDELRLVVTPAPAEEPGSYRVTCTIVSVATPQPVTLDVVLLPEKAIVSKSKLKVG